MDSFLNNSNRVSDCDVRNACDYSVSICGRHAVRWTILNPVIFNEANICGKLHWISSSNCLSLANMHVWSLPERHNDVKSRFWLRFRLRLHKFENLWVKMWKIEKVFPRRFWNDRFIFETNLWWKFLSFRFCYYVKSHLAADNRQQLLVLPQRNGFSGFFIWDLYGSDSPQLFPLQVRIRYFCIFFFFFSFLVISHTITVTRWAPSQTIALTAFLISIRFICWKGKSR